MFCAKFAENGPKVLEKIFFLFHQCIFDIILFSSHWKIPWPLFEKNLKSDVCLVFLEKKIKMWKIYKKTDGQVDDEKQAIRKAHLSFQLRLVNKKQPDLWNSITKSIFKKNPYSKLRGRIWFLAFASYSEVSKLESRSRQKLVFQTANNNFQTKNNEWMSWVSIITI